jgi:Zn-dependent protease
MVIFFVIMAYQSFTGGRFNSFSDWLISTALTLPGIVIGITVHEFSHAFAAYKLGDNTPKAQGRVTLNPLAHIDPIGIVALIFIGFGWGRPVQVNPYAFAKNRRLCNIIVDVAGVVSNFILAFLCMGLLYQIAGSSAGQGSPLYTIVLYIVSMNIVLMIFNLLPIPPLDGFGILTEIFDLRRRGWYQRLYGMGTIILLLFIIFRGTTYVLSPVIGVIFSFLASIWGAILY